MWSSIQTIGFAELNLWFVDERDFLLWLHQHLSSEQVCTNKLQCLEICHLALSTDL